MFEQQYVSKLKFVNEATMALYSVGRKTGVVLDSGHGTTRSVPVIDGTVMTSAIKTSMAAGRSINSYLAKLYGHNSDDRFGHNMAVMSRI